MICLVADVHKRLERIPLGYSVVIMLGDASFTKMHIEQLENSDTIFLLINGNNDRYIMKNDYPETTIFGGKARQISNNLFHLCNGERFNIEGNTFWCMGGAQSLNSKVLPSLETIMHGLSKLNGKVDYILTHDIPISFYGDVGIKDISTKNYLNGIFDTVYNETSFKRWYAGHHHRDVEIDKLHVIYNSPVSIR